jgi:hypothetical protein
MHRRQAQGDQGVDIATPLSKAVEALLPDPLPLRERNPGREVEDAAGRIYGVLYGRRSKPTIERILLRVGHDHVSAKALGWLAEEGHFDRNLWGRPVAPRGENVSGREEEVLTRSTDTQFTVDWAPGAEDAVAFEAAFRKAFAYGMSRRQATAGSEPAGQDRVIGERAGEVIRLLFEETPPMGFTDLVRAAGGGGDAWSVSTLSAGLGWLAAEGKVTLEGKGMLAVNLTFGRQVAQPKLDEVRGRAEALVADIAGSGGPSELSEFLGKRGGSLANAIALGILLREGKVRLEGEESVYVRKG